VVNSAANISFCACLQTVCVKLKTKSNKKATPEKGVAFYIAVNIDCIGVSVLNLTIFGGRWQMWDRCLIKNELYLLINLKSTI
jgi:hypothetical protein